MARAVNQVPFLPLPRRDESFDGGVPAAGGAPLQTAGCDGDGGEDRQRASLPIGALKKACGELGFRHIRTRPCRPRTNGRTERFIKPRLPNGPTRPPISVLGLNGNNLLGRHPLGGRLVRMKRFSRMAFAPPCYIIGGYQRRTTRRHTNRQSLACLRGIE
jgi:hypothetical protein